MNILTNKKGDLSLSINAIIIIVIAIIFLGLAIGFTVRIMDKTENTLIPIVGNFPFANPATSATPITYDGSLDIKPKDQVEFKISFYNKDSNTAVGAKPQINCVDSNGASTTKIYLNSLATDLDPYSETRYTVWLTSNGANPGNYLCYLEIRKGATADYYERTQVSLKVTS